MIDRATEWLPRLFQSSINANANPIPVADLRKLEGRTCEAFSAVAREMTHSLAIRVTSDDLARVDIGKRIHAALLKSVLKPHDCILLLDFGKAEMSDPEAVSDVSVAQFEKVMGIGIWGQVIWHATSYPERNPATSGPLIELPRTEWSAWSRAISLDGTLSQKLIYGDFAADSSKFIFASGGTAPIPHYRYSTTTHWVVVRASDGASVSDAMKEAAIRLVGSKHFAGPSFSSGDRYIAETADGRDGPGNGTIWRRVNTIHHLTRVITDLGPSHGYRIVERIGETGEQADLFRSFR